MGVPATTSAITGSHSSTTCRSNAWSSPGPKTTLLVTRRSRTDRTRARASSRKRRVRRPRDRTCARPADRGPRRDSGRRHLSAPDWLISRQRYWGRRSRSSTVTTVDTCSSPTGFRSNSRSSSARRGTHSRNTTRSGTTCPECGGRSPGDRHDGHVRRLLVVLPAISLPDLAEAPFDAERADEWLPIDVYVGGDEHAILHLLYIRFMTRALADIGLIEKREPVERLVSQGTVLYDGEKMSTSKGNVVAPSSTVRRRRGCSSSLRPIPNRTSSGPRTTFAVRTTSSRTSTGWRPSSSRRRIPASNDATTTSTSHAKSIEPSSRSPRYERFRFHRVATEIRELARLLRRYLAYDRPHDGSIVAVC